MELDGKLLEFDVGTALEGTVGKETTNTSNVSGGRKLDCCPRCFELEEKCKKAEERCGALEMEFERNKREFETLEGKLAILILDKLASEDEVRILEKGNKELQNKITDIENCKMATTVEVKRTQDVDLLEEGDKIFELMVENNALNAEVGFLEANCKNLELRLAQLEKNLYSKDGESALSGMLNVGLISSGGGREISEVNDLQHGFHGAATPVTDTPYSNRAHVDGAKSDILHENEVGRNRQARKQLAFEEATPGRKMAPVTPTSVRHPPVCPIDISDSDDEANTTNLPVLDIQAKKKNSCLSDVSVVSLHGKELISKNNLTWRPDQSDEDDVFYHNRRASSKLNAKRKRAFSTVTSDSGSDTDDNLPICMLQKDYPPESVVPSLQRSNPMTAAASGNKNGKPISRRRLVPLRKQYKEGTIKKCSYSDVHRIETQSLRGIPTNGSFTADDIEEDESDTKDESLDGFIVGSSDSEGDNASKSKDISTSDERSTAESDDTSESNMNYGDIMSRIGRRKGHLIKWVFEADMLAALGKDPELCMKAVCALYRRQTSEEKLSKATIFANQRGFSQCDAVRGSILGEFLTDGDPLGDLKKSVKELQEHDPKGVELCRTLATHYSKQLFAMYENKEDPLWPAIGPN